MKSDGRKRERWLNGLVWASVIFSFLLFGALGMLSQMQRTASVVLVSRTANVLPAATPSPVASSSPVTSATSSPAPSPSPIPALTSGMRGEEITSLQQALIHLGYMGGKPTGYYGTRTVEAVTEFQRRNALPETGVADEDTLFLLFSDTAVPSKNATYVWATKSGSKYHTDKTCSGMQNPEKYLLFRAEERGLTPCSRCG